MIVKKSVIKHFGLLCGWFGFLFPVSELLLQVVLVVTEDVLKVCKVVLGIRGSFRRFWGLLVVLLTIRRVLTTL